MEAVEAGQAVEAVEAVEVAEVVGNVEAVVGSAAAGGGRTASDQLQPVWAPRGIAAAEAGGIAASG